MSSFNVVLPIKPRNYTVVIPGIGKEVCDLSREILEKNNKQFHVFINEKRYHNHMSHHILVACSLGASKEKMQEIYDLHCKEYIPLPEPICTITRDNYKDYLGNAKAYTSYFLFFQAEVDRYGISETVRRWLWHGDFMTRTIAGTWHPIIHIGFGIEFDIPGIVAEGLAMTACTNATYTKLVPRLPELEPSWGSWFNNWSLKEQPKPMELSLDANDIPECLKDSFVFKILANVRKDSSFDGIVEFKDKRKLTVWLSNESAMERIKSYVQLWDIKETNEDVEKNLVDLHMVFALALGATGIRENKKAFLDFFFMHGLTSSELMYQYLAVVTPVEAIVLLRAHLSAFILMYLYRNRPYFNIKGLLEYKSPLDELDGNNPWLVILEKSLGYEVHVVKVVRSCAVGQTIGAPYLNSTIQSIWLKMAKLNIDNGGVWEKRGVGFNEIWE